MPSPSAARRSTNRQSAKTSPTKPKPLDIGEPVGPYDTRPVRERVRRWQQQGGGVITATDPCIEDEEEEEEEEEKSPDPKPRAGRDRDAKPTRQTPAGSPSEKEEKSTPEKARNERTSDRTKPKIRSSGTPKKRVVSDQHWRTKRSPEDKTASRKNVDTPRTRDRGSPRQSKEEASSKDELPKADPAPRVDNDGIRVYATTPSPKKVRLPKTDEEDTQESTRDSRGPDGKESTSEGSRTTPPTKRPPRKRRSETKRETGVDREPKQRSPPSPKAKRPERSSRSPESEEPPNLPAPKKLSQKNLKPPKGGIFSHVLDESKRMLGKSAEAPAQSPPQQPPPRGSRVEAWLSETLSETRDPFVDNDEEYPVEIPAPLKTNSRKKKVSGEEKVGKNDNTSTLDMPTNSEPRRRRSSHGANKRLKEQDYSMPDYADAVDSVESLDAVPEENLPRLSRSSLGVGREERESSPTSLKRTGARRRTNSSPKHNRRSTVGTPNDHSPKNANGDPHPLSDGSEESPTEWTPPLRTAKRPFPTTGMHRLSTIASVETFNPSEPATNFSAPQNRKSRSLPHENHGNMESEERDHFDPNSLPSRNRSTRSTGLKRQLTTSADLMSVLSAPGAGSRSIRSARSIRTNRSRLANATVDDLLRELTSDETKYMRELKTLVGGVIPVLLTCVLSKTDSAVAAGLFRPFGNPNNDAHFTKPIVDMGVALERLKSLHKRIPLDDSDRLLTWAKGAQKVYADYLKAWRLGFQDVVVNLAPPDENDSQAPNDDTRSLDEGLERDESGDVINADGEKVDVAYLLKRPLVRLKYLAKTFKGLNILNHSPKAEDVAAIYQGLVTDARRRANEERARLEDDAASGVDATRTRDPRTLSVLTDVQVNQTRRVRARDSFNLSLHHSSGQRVDCRAELLLRDNSPEDGAGGDLFVCEVDDTGRWLLFPPIDCGLVSARNGHSRGEIVVMIRGHPGPGRDWQELLSLKTDDEQTALEWVQMIGISPVPPKIIRTQSFLKKAREQHSDANTNTTTQPLTSTPPTKSRTPSPRHIEVPIGEQATAISSPESKTPDQQRSSSVIRRRPNSLQPLKTSSSQGTERATVTPEKTPQSLNRSRMSVSSPRNLNEAMQLAGDGSPPPLRRMKAKRISRHGEYSPTASPSTPASSTSDLDHASPTTSRKSMSTDELSKKTAALSLKSHDAAASPEPSRKSGRSRRLSDEEPVKPITRRSLSPVPSMEFPTIPKIRSTSQTSLPREGVSGEDTRSAQSTPVKKTPERPAKPAASLTDPVRRNPTLYTEDVPAPPPHKSPTPSQLKKSPVPILSPTTPRQGGKRRSSSPLKHEYEPSTASDPTSVSDTSTVEHHEVDYSSETSEEEDLEAGDIPTPIPPLRPRPRPVDRRSRPISPSQPAKAPSSSGSSSKDNVPKSPKSTKNVASIFYWSDKGSWQPLHPEECTIIISPGLIEAYELDASLAKPVDSRVASDGSSIDDSSDDENERPLVAVELTPLVPLRRGTALDISIRSPPTAKSKVKTGNNIMFRSRSPEECEILYGLINKSRINNPTYMALQNAHPPYANQPPPPQRYNSNRATKGGGLFSWAQNLTSSYRASSAPTPSVAGVSESSVGTMSSAFSALKRFGAGSKMFSIARSTITSRTGSRAGSLYSGGSFGSGSNPAPNGQPDGGIGLANTKIRLYEREGGSKWRDMGAARLTIMPGSPVPSRPSTSGAAAHDPAAGGSDATTPTPASAQPAAPHRITGQEKRIVVRGKTLDEVLLDVCLGESCFERVARTGIAVSVWEEFQGGTVAKEGGVVGGTFRVYMIQMKTEAETAYTFGLVGKQRY